MIDTLPYRQLSRLSTEYHLTIDRVLIDRFDRRFIRAIYFVLVARVCVRDWVEDGLIRPPAEPSGYQTIASVAGALKASFETTRRHLNGLVADGWCRMVPGRGVALDPDGPHVEAITALYTLIHDSFLRLGGDVAAAGVAFAPARPRKESWTLDILIRALDVNLSPFDEFQMPFADWTGMLVWTTISGANVRHILLDPVLAQTFAVAFTPDAGRRPVSVRTISRALGLPYATVWRQVRSAVESGTLTPRDGGYVATGAQLASASLGPNINAVVRYIVRKLGELNAAGFDPGEANRYYLKERPQLLDFG